MKTDLDYIDSLGGRGFEKYVYNLFKDNGIKAKLTPSSKDWGVDVIIESKNETYGIQCKLVSGCSVGFSAVQEIQTALDLRKLNKGVVITNGLFTNRAKKGAKALGIKLVDRDKLRQLVKNPKLSSIKQSNKLYKTTTLKTYYIDSIDLSILLKITSFSTKAQLLDDLIKHGIPRYLTTASRKQGFHSMASLAKKAFIVEHLGDK